MVRPIIRFLRRVIPVSLCLFVLGIHSIAANTAHAQPSTINLVDSSSTFEVWPAVTHLLDVSFALTLPQVMAKSAEFTVPRTAYGTLGIRNHAVWLKANIKVSDKSDGLWVLDIDYPPMNRLDVYLTQNNTVVQTAVFSNLNSVKERSVNSRAHSLVLKSRPGADYVVYIRAQNVGAMIFPISINKPSAFHHRALDEQMLQGVLLGLGMCFLIFSLFQAVNLRDLFFLKYALLISGSLMFSLLQSGIGGQYIWMGNPWIEIHMGGLSAFIASTGSFLFIEQSLGKEMKPTTRLTMKVGAGLCVFFALLYSFDLIGIQFVALLVSTLGLVPALLGLPGAISLARRGQKVGWYFLAAWLVYFVSTAIMVEVIKGRIGVSFWTMHSFQFGATIDMFLFMGVLGVQSRLIRDEVELNKKEQTRLMALAHSDPLTALPNRRSLYESIELALKDVGRKHFLATYMMDLDGFKAINDRYGREAGDELMIAVANRLRGLIGANGMVSRLGGDEFVILATHLQSSKQANDFGFRILQAFDEPFFLSATSCQVGLTIGYAIAPLDGNDTSGLLRQADEAMYAGKRMGKNQVLRTSAAQGLSDDELLALL